MVRFIILFYVIFSSSMLQSQVLNTDILEEDERTMYCLDNWPNYIGGVDSLKRFIYSNFDSMLVRNLSDSIIKEGVVFVRFKVDTIGSTSNHYILVSLSPEIDVEALRVLRLIRFKEPAYQNGHPVVIEYTIPIRLSLVGNYKNGKECTSKKAGRLKHLR